MASQEQEKNERITVALDSESLDRLEKIESKLMTSRSDVVRRALHYLDVVLKKGNISPQSLETILDLRSRADNLIFDIGLFQTFIDEIGDGSEELEENIKEVGREFYSEYCDMGLLKPLDCLKRLEKTNMFSLIIDSDTSFTIIPTIPEMDKYLKTFFEGYLEASPAEGEVSILHRKVRIRLTEDTDAFT